MDWINEDGTRCDPQPAKDFKHEFAEPMPTCSIGGVFKIATRMAACTNHGIGNHCHAIEPCEFKVPNVK
jgi:hypothetical protein